MINFLVLKIPIEYHAWHSSRIIYNIYIVAAAAAAAHDL
jgi:hypothetical protein